MFLLLSSIVFSVSLSVLLSRNIQNMRILEARGSSDRTRISSLPIHYVYCFFLWSLVFIGAVLITNFSALTKLLLIFSLSGFFLFLVRTLYLKKFNAKAHIETSAKRVLALTAGIGILITIAIAVSILFEAVKFFELVKPQEFLFGTFWNPQMAINSEQAVGQSAFGMIPVFVGTFLITVIAMLVAIPLGIMAATYLSFYAKPKTRDCLKPVLEILAGVPTVVYGYFAVIAIAPCFKTFFATLGFDIASESALAAGFVMGIMIVPFILSLTDDAFNSVPQTLKDGALALGSTKSEMIRKVAIGAAMPNIVAAVILAVSRAIGETMIVAMAAGLVAKLTLNPFDSVTTATVQIVTLLTGDQEFNSPKTLAAFALALTLFILTFVFNVIALIVIKNYKKKYG